MKCEKKDGVLKQDNRNCNTHIQKLHKILMKLLQLYWNFDQYNIKEIKKRINVLGKKWEHRKGNKTVPGKVATTRTEDGHKQNTKTSVII